MNARRALDLLGRVERRELERERRELATAADALREAEAASARLEVRYGEEVGLALTMPGGSRLAAAFAAGHRDRRATLGSERDRAAAERARLEAAVRERALGLKTLELAAEALTARERTEALRADQKRLDEAALYRHAVSIRAGSAGSELGG